MLQPWVHCHRKEVRNEHNCCNCNNDCCTTEVTELAEMDDLCRGRCRVSLCRHLPACDIQIESATTTRKGDALDAAFGNPARELALVVMAEVGHTGWDRWKIRICFDSTLYAHGGEGRQVPSAPSEPRRERVHIRCKTMPRQCNCFSVCHK